MKIRKSYYFMFLLDTKTNKSFSVKKATMKKAMNYAKSMLKEKYNVDQTKQLTTEQADEFIERFKKALN